MTILGHLADALTESGYDIMLSRVIPNADDWLERIVESGMLDGVLVIGQSNQLEALERVAEYYKPMVVWGSRAAGQVHCTVGVDNRAGGRLAGECLIRAGRRKLAFLGEIDVPELHDRFLGLCDAAREAGLPEPVQFHVHLASDTMAGETAGHIEAIRGGIDGVACGSDLIAMHVVRALADHAISVPGDVSVTGFDDLPLAEQTVPRLTTISQNIAEGAKEMVRLLFERIAGTESASVEMAPQLVVRDTA
jgi:DNA-binding LacI/PurR family transcriptional regulator